MPKLPRHFKCSLRYKLSRPGKNRSRNFERRKCDTSADRLYGSVSIATLSEHRDDKCNHFETPQNTKSDELPLLGLPPQSGVACFPRSRATGFKSPNAKIENNKCAHTDLHGHDPIGVRHGHKSGVIAEPPTGSNISQVLYCLSEYERYSVSRCAGM